MLPHLRAALPVSFLFASPWFAATLTAGVNTIGALGSNGIDLSFNPY